ncbi:polyamine aminopropyltransferase [Ketobacter sp. MCCC 1A13808]|uniref:polyamine aminopropyltransferase n=1 Tax=Ketobacter sp. MCCC 1A13808 TaxID=2602738 RepID=UPI000F25A8C9|nr:polyamine aminopropyltransferase [Ketobacter sp. MCCC 1A13808]MVF14494.1 polyamine aminopropyltransferase [Ketobacter sp. MCCC 1A13808]RLP55036.1 MAG: polyamine aminopropyltransferase [Ketobacter sp.]
MTIATKQNWFTEVFGNEGTSFGLEITEKLHEEQTRYQFLEIYQTKTFGKLMVLDGCVMLTERDNFLYHEMMTHPALFTHPDPKKVAIVGGGDCGTLREVLKHPSIEKCTQIDIDERVTWASQTWFPQLCDANDDPRAELLFDDGIAWIKNCEPGSLDVIIIDSTDPVGPAEGLFAVDFYRDCLKALKMEGILVQQSESPLLHTDTIIKKIHQDMRSAGFNQCQTLPFPQPVYPTGWWSCTMASPVGSVSIFRDKEAANKGFTTDYYNLEIHRAALAMPEFMKRSLTS